MDAIYKRINDDLEISDCEGESEVQKYYAGKTVFLTGSTGYMGKCLIEKLLRGCPDLKRVYVLVRPRKGSSAEERVKKYLDDVLFSPLRSISPNFASKITLIEGDLLKDGMGLSKEDESTLCEEVNIMFHNASNVKFNERLSNALKINVMGTKEMLDLAKRCKRIEAFLYVSTAYSHCYRLQITEEAYESPADMKMVQELIATDMSTPDGLSESVIPNIIGKFPNTYTFTKAIAEGLVHDASKEVAFPCIVYRPAIVMPTWKEPLRGWCGNLNGPTMLFSGYGIGIVHASIYADNILDFIPVDMSINSIIVSVSDAVIKNRANIGRPLVYNYGSSTTKPISIKRLNNYCFPPGETKDATVYQLWHVFVYHTESLWHFAIVHFIFHFIPALIADLYLIVNRKKPRAVAAFKKVTLSYNVLLYFLSRQWRIDITEMTKVIDRMNLVDRKLFFCDARELDWADYARTYTKGIRVYIFKDPMTTMPAAHRKARYFKIAHLSLMTITILLFLYVIASKLGLL